MFWDILKPIFFCLLNLNNLQIYNLQICQTENLDPSTIEQLGTRMSIRDSQSRTCGGKNGPHLQMAPA